jgi:NAD(P)-dependent dehydrogenase (short-subunit alcohol dehydrogenase family)
LQNISGIAGKHVLVTGAAGLLASQICIALAHNGAKISLLDIDHEKTDRLNQRLRDSGASSIKLPPADLLNTESVKDVLNLAESNLGPIDILIHAAYPRTADWHLKLEQIPLASWQKNVDMHLNGTFVICQELGCRMAERMTGNIILFSSIYGLVGPDFHVYKGLEQMTMPAAYSAIKGGVSNFVRYLASYWGRCGVRVNAVCPGGVFDNQNPAFVNRYVERVPMGRMGSAEDIVGPTLFLASDMSSYVTGINLAVDGGWTAI